MSEFEREDQQVMDVVNEHASPDASARAEQIARELKELDAATIKMGTVTEEVLSMSRKALRQERWYHFRCRLKALWRLIIIELLGYAALGGVLVAGMALDVVPMGVAVPVFVACFMWVAVRLDRWIRG